LRRSAGERRQLDGASLVSTNLDGADLERVDLTSAVGLTQDQLDSAIVDEDQDS
jgi:uncharacterized protein YjbI with pentapeptide repeats